MDFEHWGAKTSKILSALFSRSDASNAATLDASQLGILDLFSASGADKFHIFVLSDRRSYYFDCVDYFVLQFRPSS